MKTYRSYLKWFKDQLEKEYEDKTRKDRLVAGFFMMGSVIGTIVSFLCGINPFDVLVSIEGIATIVLVFVVLVYLYLKEEEIELRKIDFINTYKDSFKDSDPPLEKVSDKRVDAEKIEAWIEEMIKAKLNEVVKYPKIPGS